MADFLDTFGKEIEDIIVKGRSLKEGADKSTQNIIDTAFDKVTSILKRAYEDARMINRPKYSSAIEQLDKLAKLASELDETDPQKADIIDSFIQKIASQNAVTDKEYQDARDATMERDYKEDMERFKKDIGSENIQKAVDKTMKQYKPGVYPLTLSTRYCPDHPGESLMRVGDGLYKCSLDGKVYDWLNGFSLLNGKRVPGGTVALQTQIYSDEPSLEAVFSTRESRQKD